MSILVISASDASTIKRALVRLETKLDKLILQGVAQHMALSDDLNSIDSSIDSSLTKIAADIRSLKDSAPAGGLTAADAEALKAKLEALASRAAGIDAETPDAPAV